MEAEAGMLELTDGQRERIKELQALADEAEGGDREARGRLRRELRDSAPEVIARCSDTATSYRGLLAKTASGGNKLVQDAIVERSRLVALELAGEDPTPLEVLLSERVASLWVLVELQEALNSAWYSGQTKGQTSPAFLLQMARLQESAHRRYLQAIKTLAQGPEAAGPGAPPGATSAASTPTSREQREIVIWRPARGLRRV
jgi:hypothetical protein